MERGGDCFDEKWREEDSVAARSYNTVARPRGQTEQTAAQAGMVALKRMEDAQ